MDSYLIDYIKSGKAWVLIGSGPSTQMGYPSWERLASLTIELVKKEAPANSLPPLEKAMRRQNFPEVFELAKSCLGAPRLLHHLHDNFKPSRPDRIYELLARWPIPVYLTTNFDDEIHNSLVAKGAAYKTYSNSEDHLGFLLPELDGAIFKLHGDLRSEDGLILTSQQYKNVSNEEAWKYWRTKMTSVFQMNRVVVIGHSLSDANIKHVLKAAKQGAGVLQPICWIAPDVKQSMIREYLGDYRIRVISYDNRDGEHNNLLRLMENINDFVPPRTSIAIRNDIIRVSQSPLGANAAAPGFFIFNKLAVHSDFEELRTNIILASIQAALAHLSSVQPFSFQKALEAGGWPKDHPIDAQFAENIRGLAVDQKLLAPEKDKFIIAEGAINFAEENRKRFEHMKERFKSSLVLRLRRDYPALSELDSLEISSDIESSLTGYFREGGLTLASTLFSSSETKKRSTIPSSILKFIVEASAKYDDLLKRQAFFSVSIDTFIRAESAEKEYLGRIAQGFFAFHSLGVFGEAAIERLKNVKDTVWIIDSSAQILALAAGAPTNVVFRDCFEKLHELGVRLFTTQKLFEETQEHLWFANKLIREDGPTSPFIITAAKGQAPFRKTNQFLAGFIRWQAAGNQRDWGAYLFHIFGNRDPGEEEIKDALNKIGIEIVALDNWPGYAESDQNISDTYAEKIKRIWESRQELPIDREREAFINPLDKAIPEAEALLVVLKERKGDYYILSTSGSKSSAWFISQTSILNLVEQGPRITWQPEAFVRFTSTLSHASNAESANRSFETLLWSFAQSGMSLLNDQEIEIVFGGIIDQATISIVEQKQAYTETIAKKYGESAEAVMAGIAPLDRPLAALQFTKEIAEVQKRRRIHAEELAAAATKRASLAERKLGEVERFRKKMEERKAKAKHKTKKQKSSSGKKKGKKK